MKSALIAAIAAAFVLLGAAPAQAGYAMHIGRIQYNPPGPDTHSNSQINREYVTLHNTAGRKVVLTGWRLSDRSGHTYLFSRFTLRAHASVRIHTGRGRNTATDRYWGRSWYVWNNTGDTATLRDAHRHVIDRCSWKGDHTATTC